jgi:beta-N-acetylhexosaminidase
VQRGRKRWGACAAGSAVALACAVTAACSGAGGAPASQPGPSQAASSPTSASADLPASSPTTATLPTGQPGGTAPAASACVSQVLVRLTLAQQVGQLFIVGVAGDASTRQLADAVRSYHFGSLLLTPSATGTAALAGQVTAMQSHLTSGTGGIGFFIGANQEGGAVQQLTGPGFATMPSALVQGGWPPATLRAAATQWGTDLRAAGVNLNLAPVMDVVPQATAAANAPIGALNREFGFDPATTGAHGVAFMQGMAAAGVMSVAKHFPGLGRVTGNTDFTPDVVDDVTTASDPDLDSFRAAIDAGVPMVMVALATYTKIDPSQLAVFSPEVMRLLRDGLGFTGVIVSDDLGQAKAVQAIPAGNRALSFLAAGGDLVTSQTLGPAEQMAAAVLAKASGDAAFRATVDAAAARVLAAKQAAGLLPCR